MSHEPGRERHMTYRCENCGSTGPLMYLSEYDEYICEECAAAKEEAVYNRYQESLMESPPETAREEQIRTWEEKQRLHRR